MSDITCDNCGAPIDGSSKRYRKEDGSIGVAGAECWNKIPVAEQDLYQRYADHFGITRAETKERLFHIAYSVGNIDMRQFVTDAIEGNTPMPSTRGRFTVEPTALLQTADVVEGLEPILGGWIVARTDEYVIDVVLQLFNWRLHVATAEQYGKTYEHGYCFFGRSSYALQRAIEAARAWTNPLDTDPVGFDKKAF